MQPLLLLKQTLEVSYDPGPLLLEGPNVRFSHAEQLFSHLPASRVATELQIKLSLSDQLSVGLVFDVVATALRSKR